jgi:hypothetical protein
LTETEDEEVRKYMAVNIAFTSADLGSFSTPGHKNHTNSSKRNQPYGYNSWEEAKERCSHPSCERKDRVACEKVARQGGGRPYKIF